MYDKFSCRKPLCIVLFNSCSLPKFAIYVVDNLVGIVFGDFQFEFDQLHQFAVCALQCVLHCCWTNHLAVSGCASSKPVTDVSLTFAQVQLFIRQGSLLVIMCFMMISQCCFTVLV